MKRSVNRWLTLCFAGIMAVTLLVASGWNYLCFSDDGTPFDPTTAIMKEKPFEELDGGGMGLGMIRKTASDIRYERKDGRNELTLVFKTGE